MNAAPNACLPRLIKISNFSRDEERRKGGRKHRKPGAEDTLREPGPPGAGARGGGLPVALPASDGGGTAALSLASRPGARSPCRGQGGAGEPLEARGAPVAPVVGTERCSGLPRLCCSLLSPVPDPALAGALGASGSSSVSCR